MNHNNSVFKRRQTFPLANFFGGCLDVSLLVIIEGKLIFLLLASISFVIYRVI